MSLRDKYTREEFEDKENQIRRNKKDSLDMYDLLKPIKCSEITDEIGHLPDNYIEQKISKEIYANSMIEAINHKVYEKQIHGEDPKAAIVSLEGYGAIQQLYEFGIKSISIRGCELKLYPSPILSAEEIEIY